MFACYCASVECQINGCRIAREARAKYAPVTVPQRGCICPPTSEKTCQSASCPRKA